MFIQQWLDREIIKVATNLGGTGPVRDDIVFILANILPLALLVAGIWLFFSGRTKAQKERNQNVMFVAAGAAVIAAGIRALLANTIARDRPFDAYPHLHHLDSNFTGAGVYSFPSGHAFIMFAFVGTVFFIGQHRKLSWFLIGIAVVVCLARIVAGYHYPTDIIGGTLLGLGLARLLSWQSGWARRQIAS